MKVAFWCLLALGAAVFVLSVLSAVFAWKEEGRVGLSVAGRVFGSVAWTIFFYGWKKHPEWMHEKF